MKLEQCSSCGRWHTLAQGDYFVDVSEFAIKEWMPIVFVCDECMEDMQDMDPYERETELAQWRAVMEN